MCVYTTSTELEVGFCFSFFVCFDVSNREPAGSGNLARCQFLRFHAVNRAQSIDD